jgi:hypothetical protein
MRVHFLFVILLHNPALLIIDVEPDEKVKLTRAFLPEAVRRIGKNIVMS